MSLIDDEVLGHVTNTGEEGEEDQYELNEELLILHDKNKLSESLKYRINNEYLNFLYSRINNNKDFWSNFLIKISSEYNLNVAKLYADGIIDNEDLASEVKKFYKYLKLNLINDVELNKIDKDLNRDQFERYIQDKKAPRILIYSIVYIDRVSYKKFINRLFNEVNLDFLN